ncbi:MAG: hypothetical protein II921_02990, partial [Treponema sp.]|nr:hypothetical protein [Treponema sp.]
QEAAVSERRRAGMSNRTLRMEAAVQVRSSPKVRSNADFFSPEQSHAARTAFRSERAKTQAGAPRFCEKAAGGRRQRAQAGWNEQQDVANGSRGSSPLVSKSPQQCGFFLPRTKILHCGTMNLVEGT